MDRGILAKADAGLGEEYSLISAAARLELFKQVPGPIPQPEKIHIIVTLCNY